MSVPRKENVTDAWTREGGCDEEQEEEEAAVAWTATCAHGHLIRLRTSAGAPAPLPGAHGPSWLGRGRRGPIPITKPEPLCVDETSGAQTQKVQPEWVPHGDVLPRPPTSSRCVRQDRTHRSPRFQAPGFSLECLLTDHTPSQPEGLEARQPGLSLAD